MSIAGIENAYPLTPAQTGMLFHVLESPDSNVYMAYVSTNIEGSIDVPRLRASWEDVLTKHEALRAAFLWDGLDEPLQVIHASTSLPWKVDHLELGHNPPSEKDISRIIEQELVEKIDISQAPLTRVRLIQLGTNQWKMIWLVHHLLVDGWCTPIILNDLTTFYASRSNSNGQNLQLKEPVATVPFSEHVAWLINQDQTTALDHWRQYLKNATRTPLQINANQSLMSHLIDDSRSLDSHLLVNEPTLTFTVAETQDLKRFASHHHITISTLMHLCWGLVLAEYAATSKPLFGTASAGRQSGMPNIENSVGLFLNTLPVVLNIEKSKTIIELLIELQKSMFANTQFEYASLSEIQKMVPRSSNEPLFDCVIAMESHTGIDTFDTPAGDLCISDIKSKTYSNFTLSLLVTTGDALNLQLMSDNGKIASPTTHQILDRLINIIRQVVISPEVTAEYLLNSRDFNQQYLEEASGASQSRALESYSQFEEIHRWIESTIDNNPDKTAVVASGLSLTFLELDQQANQVARSLLEVKNRRPVSSESVTHESADNEVMLVGILLPRGCDQVAAILGVLKSGMTYVPLNPDHPESKIAEIMNLSGIRTVISTEIWQSKIQTATVAVLTMAQCQSQRSTRLTTAEISNQNSGATPKLVYVMYTSGSTGSPKGVMVSHKNLIYSTATRIQFYQHPSPIFLMLSSITFDSSVAGLFWTLCDGGTLVLPEPEEEKDLSVIGSMIQNYSVTHTLCLPSLYHLILQYIGIDKLSSLSSVIVAGEQCQLEVVKTHQATLPSTRLFNEYGPTEATVWSTVAEIGHSSAEPVGIGLPIGDSLILLLSTDGRICPQGVIGEMYIGGKGVAIGYHRLTEETEQRFVGNPINPQQYPVLFRTGDLAYRDSAGQLVFQGRIDRQLKIRGNRIEPAEIESILKGADGVSDIAIVGVNRIRKTETTSFKITPAVEHLDEALQQLTEPEAEQLLLEAES